VIKQGVVLKKGGIAQTRLQLSNADRWGKQNPVRLNNTSKTKLQELEALDPARLEKVITLNKKSKELTANEPKIAQWLENKREQFKCHQGGTVYHLGSQITALEIAALDKIDARLLQRPPKPLGRKRKQDVGGGQTHGPEMRDPETEPREEEAIGGSNKRCEGKRQKTNKGWPNHP
jgi:hypothetical protein